jgi:hypothetical protein
MSPKERAGVIAQMLINNRHGYGTIKEYKLLTSMWAGFGKRYVTIQVKASAQQAGAQYQLFNDCLTLMKKEGDWGIRDYRSGSPWRSKAMP